MSKQTEGDKKLEKKKLIPHEKLKQERLRKI